MNNEAAELKNDDWSVAIESSFKMSSDLFKLLGLLLLDAVSLGVFFFGLEIWFFAEWTGNFLLESHVVVGNVFIMSLGCLFTYSKALTFSLTLMPVTIGSVEFVFFFSLSSFLSLL